MEQSSLSEAMSFEVGALPSDGPPDLRRAESKRGAILASNSKYGFRCAIYVKVHRFTADFGATMRVNNGYVART